jgi:hypothetical protein
MPNLPNPPDVSTSTSQDLRCPRCDAHVRAGADWCTLCYHDLRPAVVEPEPVVVPVDEPELADVDTEPAPESGSESAPARTGRHAAGPDTTSASGNAPGLPDAQIALMLAQLAAEESGPPLGSISSKVATPGAKAVLIIGGSVLATVLAWLLMTLFGTLL